MIRMPHTLCTQLLIKPHSRFIGKKRTVFLVPDDILYKLPFEALLTNRFDRPRRAGEEKVVSSALKDAPFWIRYHDIAYLPSLSVLSLDAHQKGQGGAQKKGPTCRWHTGA